MPQNINITRIYNLISRKDSNKINYSFPDNKVLSIKNDDIQNKKLV